MDRGQRRIYERTSRQNFGVFKGRNQAPSERSILSKEGPARGSRFLKLKKSFHNWRRGDPDEVSAIHDITRKAHSELMGETEESPTNNEPTAELKSRSERTARLLDAGLLVFLATAFSRDLAPLARPPAHI